MTTIKQVLHKMTKGEKEMVEHYAFTAAIAIANYWDALRTIEVAHGVEFDGTVAALETLATVCLTPATLDDFKHLSAEDVMEQFDIDN